MQVHNFGFGFRWIDNGKVDYGAFAPGYPVDDKYGKPCVYIQDRSLGTRLL